jgi:chemotaxis family two-component system sensor kinase Cph1
MNCETPANQADSLNYHDTQPIHTPGTIQPHGVLLVLTPSLQIVQISDNTQKYFGKTPEQLLNQHLNQLLDIPQIAVVEQQLAQNPANSTSFKLAIPTPIGNQYFDIIAHRHEVGIILEIEPTVSLQPMSLSYFHGLMSDGIAQIQQTSNANDFLHLVADKVQKITGFDRVLVYKFNEDGSGSVITEVNPKNLSSYLGLNFPANDIPRPARELYTRTKLRFIPDFNAEASYLIPQHHSHSLQPLDLTYAVLRSVNSCCIKYHQNMGVAALLVISVVQDQKLWGLISCHHQTPKYLTYETRMLCELFGQIVSLELSKKVIQEDIDYKNKLKTLQSQFIESISQANNFVDALIHPGLRLLNLVSADGCAVCLDNEITVVGNAPDIEAIRKLIGWIDSNISDDLFSTNALPKLNPDAEAFKDTASGLLVLRISRVRRYYILWFRPEVIQTVNWAGNPNLVLNVADDGNFTLSPRQSFELWQETVRLTSLPWKQCELDSAVDLRNAIVSIILNKADEFAKIILELECTNRELDSFAYAASHDLKEPLRGIHNYSTILLEDYGYLIDTEGIDYLNTLVRLTQRMDSLIDALLRLSQLGQAQIKRQTTDFNELLSRVLEMFHASRQEKSVDIRIPRPLPMVECNSVLVSEVFTNLISNAFKYCDRTPQWIEVGYLDSEPLVFYIRDNGIGIQSHHQETIFRLFKRLHSQEKYGGGTGAGLAIAKKIVERHGGKIWVESIYGEGSTFFFTLHNDEYNIS